MKGRPLLFNAAMIANIVQAYATGKTMASIAKYWYCDVTTIRRTLHRAGVAIRSQHARALTDEQALALVADYADMSLTQLADKYDISHGTARSYLIRAGVPRRPRGGANYHGRRA